MQHLPLFADLKNRAVLVVGGGVVAERRVNLLLSAGANVTLIAPLLTSHLAELAEDGRLTYLARVYADDSLEPYWLVIAATDERAVNARVAAAAEAAKRFCNVVDDLPLCSFIMPAIVDRAPVTIAIGSSGNSPVLTRWVKGIVETLLPSRLGALAELAGRWRERVRGAVPDATERRHFWERVVNGTVAEHAFAGREADAEHAMQSALASWGSDEVARRGEAYLVGAGPGSPDLITIRGRQLLASADVVLYDRLASIELLQYARRDAELICVGKTPRRPSITQKQLNRLLVGLVQSGKRVCRLKGGDPFIFGRGGEELEALATAGLKFQVVPGVSAAEGCACTAAAPGDAAAMQGLAQAEGALGGALGRLMAVFEAYPDLKANQNILQVQEELTSTENKIAFARQAYNDSVMEYNTKRESFPDTIFAGMFGFTAATLLEATESAEERKAPKVSFK